MYNANYKLYYWPLPFRGCFISYLFAYRGVPLQIENDYEENNRLKNLDPKDQQIPYIGPPVLLDLETDQAISQMPAIALYASEKLDLLPKKQLELCMAVKVLMDCNDVLMEICRYNGSMMWEREEWIKFRSQRLPHWMRVFEASFSRGLIGGGDVTFADIGVYALFGNMIRCLPDLETALLEYAPSIHNHCRTIGSEPSLAEFVLREKETYGELYCGGQIEASIRKMLELDRAS